MEFLLEWPQLVYLALVMLGLGVSLEQHGKPKTGDHSFWVTAFATVITCTLLYCGGFFTK